jgi:CDGSH-type Zn-finger protein
MDVESRDEVVIVPYSDGPYLVRGPAVMRDQQGRPIALPRRPTALCRCGKSRIRPFCDGTHQLIRFSAPSEPELASDDAPPRSTSRAPSTEQPAQARPAPAGAAVDAARAIMSRAIETPPDNAGRSEMSAASALLTGVLNLLDAKPRERACGEAALFLIRGALQALQPLASAGEEPAVRAVAELQRAAADLEEHHGSA